MPSVQENENDAAFVSLGHMECCICCAKTLGPNSSIVREQESDP
jgi:hypothetical protein